MCNMITIFNKIVDSSFESAWIINIWNKKIIPNSFIHSSQIFNILSYIVPCGLLSSSHRLNLCIVLSAQNNIIHVCNPFEHYPNQSLEGHREKVCINVVKIRNTLDKLFFQSVYRFSFFFQASFLIQSTPRK